MKAYGDESGNFNNLLSGNEPYFALAVVAGEGVDCQACSKRTVRNASQMKEAKWNDLTDVQKRRFLDSVSERGLDVCYTVVEFDQFDRMRHGYALHHAELMDVRPASFVTGAMYAALLLSLDASVSKFQFDRVWSQKISAEVIDVMADVGTDVDAEEVISSQSKGVQTADCAAGAAREHAIDGSRPSVVEEWRNKTDYAMATVEAWLSEYRQ